MNKAKEESKLDPELWFIMDCRWASRGYNSEHATVYILDGKKDKVLLLLMLVMLLGILMRMKLKIIGFFVHKNHLTPIMQIHTKTAFYSYIGSSRGMECCGLRMLLQQAKTDGLHPNHYSHDEDGCT